MNLFKYTSLLGILLIGNQIFGQITTYSNEFLSLGVGAKAFAMGNAQVASVNDVTAGYWNPAGLVDIKTTQLALMHSEWFASIAKYDYVAVAIPLANSQRTVGVSIIRFGVDDIPNTLYLIEPDGSFNYDNLSTFSSADYAVYGSIAQQIKNLKLGANIKIIHRKVGSFANAWGFGIDVAVQYTTNSGIRLGGVIRDLTTTPTAWSYSFTDEERSILLATDNVVPDSDVELTGQRIILGAGYAFDLSDKLSLYSELNTDITIDGKRNVLIQSDPISIDPHLGIDLQYDELVSVRFGLSNIQYFKKDENPDDRKLGIQPNAGIGLSLNNLQLDYAFTGLNNTSEGLYSHIISLIIDFNKI